MNEVIKSLLERRSCRKFKPENIKEEELDAILEAGTYAPTGMGKQSPLIVSISNKEDRDALERLNAEVLGDANAKPFYGAPNVVVVFGQKDIPFCIHDANLVLGNILNAAYALGIDSCYIWRAKESLESEGGKELLKKWGVPDGYVAVANVILGYGIDEGRNVAPPRKEGYIIKV